MTKKRVDNQIHITKTITNEDGTTTTISSVKDLVKRQTKSHYLTELPNIFKPIQRGARQKAIEIPYKNSSGAKITVGMWWQLDIADQDLFLTIISIISEFNYGKTGGVDSDNVMTQHLREKMELKEMLFDLPILKMKTTIYHLLETMGKSPNGRSNYKWCLDSLERLSKCFVDYDTNKYRGSSSLLSFSIDKNTNEIHIGLNPISASVFLSGDKYVIHNLTERFSLKMEATKALQSYLNKQLSPGQTKPLKLDTIVEGVYGADEELDPKKIKEFGIEINPMKKENDLKNRRRIIKKAIEELIQHKEYKYIVGLNGSYNFTRHPNLLKI